MFRFLTLSLLFVVSLYAMSDAELLKRANGFMKTSNKTDQFRAYNDYKNLYLRALMSENDKIKISALQGIVSSGTKLHIDVSQYSEELMKINATSSYAAPKQKTISTENQSKKIAIQSSHSLKSVRWKDERLVMSFDKQLQNNQINYFTKYDSKSKKYQYIFDIHASMLVKSQSLHQENIESIKLEQYNPTMLRLTIEDNNKVKIQFKKDLETLVIKMETKADAKQNNNQIVEEPAVILDRNKVIVIDAGHGGKDPGAVGYKNYREKVVVLQIAQELRKILKTRGFKVYMTRDSDKFVKLSHRTKFANDKNADLFISIHANAVADENAKKACGIECYFLSTSRSSRAKKVAEQENMVDLSEMDYFGKESFLNTLNSHNIVAANKLAIDLQRGALASLNPIYKNVNDAGVREGPFWVLVGAQMPAVLVEVGFISHPEEAKKLVDRKYQERLALGLANGVERYFLNN